MEPQTLARKRQSLTIYKWVFPPTKFQYLWRNRFRFWLFGSIISFGDLDYNSEGKEHFQQRGDICCPVFLLNNTTERRFAPDELTLCVMIGLRETFSWISYWLYMSLPFISPVIKWRNVPNTLVKGCDVSAYDRKKQILKKYRTSSLGKIALI